MHTTRTLAAVVSLTALTTAAGPAGAQQVQIPTLQVCNATVAGGTAKVKVDRRTDIAHSGTFEVRLDVSCDSNGYPSGTLTIEHISMSDTSAAVSGTIQATTIDQVTTTGKHTPTVYMNGRCKGGQILGCRFWMMIADNRGPNGASASTPDIVSFLVFDKSGHRVAYGTGPVVAGDLTVNSTGN